MTIAVDTNVIQALWSGTPAVSGAAQAALERTSNQSALVMSAVVYAELVAAPGRDMAAVDLFVDIARIRIDWQFEPVVWRTAAQAFQGYAERRRAQERGAGPRRILADFLIGAHALHHASALLTFDQGIYHAAFPDLPVLLPD
jgi:predicted nucleic acid-binding protein